MAFGGHFYVTIHCTILLTIPFTIPHSIFIVIFKSHLLLNWNFLLKMGLTSSWQKQENNTHGMTLHLHLKWPSQNQRKKEGEGGEVKQSLGRIQNSEQNRKQNCKQYCKKQERCNVSQIICMNRKQNHK